MTPDERPDRATGEITTGSIAAEVRLAASFLTIVPFAGSDKASDETVAASFAWFPLIGFILGAALCVEDAILSRFFPQVLRSVIVILSITAISGAVHLDALADTADALGAGRDRERALQILRDSRIGSFGAIALFFALVLKILALATMGAPRRYAALYFAPGLARWAMVAVSQGFDYLRGEGAGATLLSRKDRRNLILATVTAIAATLAVFSLRMIETASVAVIVTIAIRAFYRRWLGGVTGDLIGACGELVEIVALVTMSL